MEKYQAQRNDMKDIEVPEKTEKEKKQEATEKAVDMAGEMALDYFTGGQFSQVKDGLSNIPVVGNAVNKEWNKAVSKVSKVVAKTPTGDMLKKADESGLTDTARDAYGMYKNAKNAGTNPGGQNATPGLDGKTNPMSSGEAKPNGGTSGTLGGSKSSLGGSTSGMLSGNVMDMLPTSLKIKIAVCAGGVLFLIMIITTVVSGKDFVNLETTNKSSMTPKSVVSVTSTYLSGGEGLLMSGGQSISSLITQEKFNSLNDKIKNDVLNAGLGTGDAVAVAAYDLIQGFLDEGIILPYFWSGGHGVIADGIDPNWGNMTSITYSGSSLQPVGSSHPYGLDCSGFVSWALKNGGCTNFTPMSSSNFISLGNSINATSAKAGDIAANSTHVMMIIDNTGNSLIVAEAKSVNIGIVFSEFSYDKFNKYTVVDMTDYYANNCKG